VDKILKGTPPANLPIERAVKFDLVVNLKTAKTLGVTVPLTLIASADGVIAIPIAALHESAFGPKRTSPSALHIFAYDPKRTLATHSAR
jgi:putative ABC transport system substrate-binding protein